MNERHKENGTAIPQHWRSRTNVHEKNVAALLIERGQQGMCVQGAFMYEHPELYGRSPRSRVSDLIHKRGWDIGSKPGQHGCQCYWVRRAAEGRTYPTERFEESSTAPRPHLANQPESNYMRRQREEQERAAPLFAGVSAEVRK